MQPLQVDGTPEAVQQVADYVAAAARQAGLDARTTYYLCLAVDEIATNIVIHGYAAHNQQGALLVEALIEVQELMIVLEDTGVSFDPRQAPQPDLHSPPEKRSLGGLGIFLALRGVDRFHYERMAGRNRCAFVVQRPV